MMIQTLQGHSSRIPILWYDCVGSTNTMAKRYVDTVRCVRDRAFVAHEQTAGRGQYERSWYSPPGGGIYMSLVMNTQGGWLTLATLTQDLGHGIARYLESIIGMSCDVKLPNDILINGKKIAGILVEGGGQLPCSRYIIVGIGINVGITSFPPDLEQSATSLALVQDESIDAMNVIVMALIAVTYSVVRPLFLGLPTDQTGLQ